jgi:hypothetical protein
MLFNFNNFNPMNDVRSSSRNFLGTETKTNGHLKILNQLIAFSHLLSHITYHFSDPHHGVVVEQEPERTFADGPSSR